MNFKLFGNKPKRKPLEIDLGNFNKEIFESELPVVLDFYATWCQPCQVMSSLMTRLAKEESLFDKVKIAKVDIDYSPQIAQHFAVKSVPTLLFIFDKKVLQRETGLMPYTLLLDKTEKLIESTE